MAARLVVEWTRSTVRLAIGHRQGPGFRLSSLRVQPIAAADGVAEAMRALLAAARLRVGEVIGVISREQVITRTVKFPSTDVTELAQMVELYAKGQLPYPREQLVMDWYVVDHQEGFSTVAIVACQRDVVDRHVSLLREAGLSPRLLTVSSWGLLGWYRQLRRAAAEPVLIVNIDDTRTDLVLLTARGIISTRSIGQGMQDWSGSGDVMEFLALETERSRTAIRKELTGSEARSVILTGLGPQGQWAEPLAARLGLPVEVVESVRPFSGRRLSLPPGASPVVSGGLACGTLRELLDLSPPELHAHAQRRRQVREVAAIGTLLLSLVVATTGVLALRVARERRVAVQLDEAVAAMEPAAKRLQQRSRSSQLVGSMLETRRRLARALADIFQQTPSTVTLQGVAFERARSEVGLRGHAESTQAVLDYLKQLGKVGGVGEVYLKYSTRRSTPAGERIDFEVVLREGARQAEAAGASPAGAGAS